MKKRKTTIKKIHSCRKRRGCFLEPYELMLGRTFETVKKAA